MRLFFIRLFPPFFVCSMLMVSLYAQQPVIDDFTISGDTYRTADECFRLTAERNYSSGSIWYRQPISLSAPFSIELTLMLGCKDSDGADGMVFVFTSEANQVGYRGEGIGFGGLVPSVGIEIDTWLNYHLNDPMEDHVAIMANGRVGHYNDLAGPNVISNIEDCKRHKLAIRWKPESQTLSVELDGKVIISAQNNLIKNIFNGNDRVYWGVTAATGRFNNYHEVCFDRLSMKAPVPFIDLPEHKNPADRFVKP